MMRKIDFPSLFIMLIGTLGGMHGLQAATPASQWQDPAAILATARSFIEAHAAATHSGRSEISLGQLDPRLRLSACRGPLSGFLPAGGRESGNTTVGVRCDSEGGWSIYVSVRIDVFGPVLVARQPLARGQDIHAADLDLVERNLANLPYGYYTDPGAIAGQLAKRTIAAATVITPNMLAAPKLVKRGEQVSIIAESGPLTIRSAGKALGDGTSGDLVKVRAQGSQRVIDGIVVSRGVVKVTL